MLITNDFEVPQPVDRVWAFFDDIPGVATCLPGAELTEELGPDEYAGQVGIRMGPVKLQFSGTATITGTRRRRPAHRRRRRGSRREGPRSGRHDADGRAHTRRPRAQPSRWPRTSSCRAPPPSTAGAWSPTSRPYSWATSPPTCRPGWPPSNRVCRLTRSPRPSRPAALPSAFAAAKLALARVFRRFFLPYRPNPS